MDAVTLADILKIADSLTLSVCLIAISITLWRAYQRLVELLIEERKHAETNAADSDTRA